MMGSPIYEGLWYNVQDGALAEKLGNGLQNRVDGSVTRRCLQISPLGVIFLSRREVLGK